MEDIVERGYVIIGSPEEVVEQLTELATDLNVGHLMLLMQFGCTGKELAAYNTKLFADRVFCQSCAASSPNGKTAGGRSRCRARNAPRSRPLHPLSLPWTGTAPRRDASLVEPLWLEAVLRASFGPVPSGTTSLG